MLFYLTSDLILVISLLLCASFVNLLFHELGHAIPVLFWSKKKTTVYIGSFGDRRQSVRCKMGKLELLIKVNPLLWFRGMCQPGEMLPVNKTVFHIAMGPVVSLTLAVISFYLSVEFQVQGASKLLLGFICFFAFGGFLGSTILPGKIRFSGSGDRLYNDGTLIIRTIRFRKLWPDYEAAVIYINERKLGEALILLEKLISNKFENARIYRLLILTNIHLKQFEQAQHFNRILKEKYLFIADDHCNDGFIQLNRRQHAK